jgi:hypothetical protein
MCRVLYDIIRRNTFITTYRLKTDDANNQLMIQLHCFELIFKLNLQLR